MPEALLIKPYAWKTSIKPAPRKEASVTKSMGFREACLLARCFKLIKLPRAPHCTRPASFYCSFDIRDPSVVGKTASVQYMHSR